MKILLKITSIIYIVFAAISIIFGVLCLLAAIASYSVSNIEASQITGVSDAMVFGIAISTKIIFTIIASTCVCSGIFELIIGIFGIKGAKGNKSLLKAGFVLAIICLILGIVSMLVSYTSAGAIGVTQILLALLYAFAARKISKEE